jgi:hypothetical protein
VEDNRQLLDVYEDNIQLFDGCRTIDRYWLSGGQYTVIGWVEANGQLLDGWGTIDSYWMGGGQ